MVSSHLSCRILASSNRVLIHDSPFRTLEYNCRLRLIFIGFVVLQQYNSPHEHFALLVSATSTFLALENIYNLPSFGFEETRHLEFMLSSSDCKVYITDNYDVNSTDIQDV